MKRSISTYFFALLVAAFLLEGCRAGKDYKRADTNIPESFGTTSTADSSLALKPWREFFQDTTLVSLIDQALSNNFDLQIAIRQVGIYESLSKRARAAWLPALNLQASGSTFNPSGNSLNGISLENFLGASSLEDYTLSAELSWEIDVWGKIKRAREAAAADYLETYEAQKAVRTMVVAQVADAYYNLLMMESQLAIAHRNVELNDSTVRMMQLQQTAGEVTSLAVEQALAQKQTSELLVHQLEQAKLLQQNGLKVLLGDWPGEFEFSELYDFPDDASLATGVPADLLQLRPDVRASEQALIAANARVGVATGNLYPSLSLTASGGLNSFQSSNWFQTPASLFGTVAGNLTQPIFARRTLKTNLEVAEWQREQSYIAFRQTVTLAVHDVVNALIELDKLTQQQEVASGRVQTLERAVNNSQLLFRSGMANYLEVLIAQRSALDARLEKAIITRQQMVAYVELYRALGGGSF